MRAALFSPHADDEVLFAAYVLMRERPHVVIVCPSAGDYGSTNERLVESRAAVAFLGAGPVEQWAGAAKLAALEARMRAFDETHAPATVWAPHREASHPDHRAVSCCAAVVFGDRVRFYHTYQLDGVDPVKVTGRPIVAERGWKGRKRLALKYYRTQITHPRARVFFDLPLDEYQGD